MKKSSCSTEIRKKTVVQDISDQFATSEIEFSSTADNQS